METRTYRILIGQFFHETHGFNPHVTTSEKITVGRGQQLIEKARGTGTTLGGIISKLTELGCEIVPGIGFIAQPSGRIDQGFFAAIRDEFLAMARRKQFDAIALDMHGAMGTTELSDADGDLLEKLRATVGPDLPIGIGLDMHGHVTGAMLRAVDICIACKECPHTDFPQCGEKVVECLVAVLDGRLRPVRVMAKAPMINLDSGLTAGGPLAEIKARAEALGREHSDIWDISLYQVFRFSDFEEQKGQTAIVLSNGDAQTATRIAEDLANQFWEKRELFREDLYSIEDALDLISSSPAKRPYVLGDMGDRVLAGAPGDSTAILVQMLRRADDLRGAIPITDPVSVDTATVAGLGATVTLTVGGRFTPGFSPLKVTGTVLHLGDGKFVISGAVFAGQQSSLGRTAVVLVDDRLSLLLTSEPGFTHTPAAFSSQGIDLCRQDLIVAKSGMHFQSNFAGVATPLSLATPGLSFFSKGFFPWKNANFWPEREFADPDIRARIFEGREEREPLRSI